MSPESLHYLLMRHVIDHGHAPDLRTLSSLAALSEAETEAVLRRLESIHGVILVPNSTAVWSLHPFAMLPTAFWVESQHRGWWANCAWCSLGIGAALQEDTIVNTAFGGEGERLRLEIAGHGASRSDVVMHFPYPPARWWDNPYCPCGNILFFRSQAEVEEWSRRHGRPSGAVLDIDTAIQLGRRWFGDYASPQWRRKTPAEAAAIFDDLGLDPAFWEMKPTFR